MAQIHEKANVTETYKHHCSKNAQTHVQPYVDS